MPESVMEFLGALLNISKADFVRFQKRVADEELPEYNDDDDDVNDARRSIFLQPAAACPKWHRRGGVRRRGS